MLSLPGNLARRRLALAQRFLKAFDRHGQANLVPIPEAIGNRLCDAENYVSALLAKARRDEGLRAFITLDEPGALSAARTADKARAKGLNAPLLGVPLGIKDSYLTAGLRTTLGVGALRDFQPTEDADAVATLKAAGAIVLGKTNWSNFPMV